ncbi:MAG: rhodanese-like domain-containing protein [Ferruginibacter sp.]
MFGILKKLIQSAPAADYKALVKSGALIIDVRTPGEYREGHIKGSVNIPLDQVKSRINELKKSNKPIITCCRSGSRSGMAKSLITASGIECYNGGPWDDLNNVIR